MQVSNRTTEVAAERVKLTSLGVYVNSAKSPTPFTPSWRDTAHEWPLASVRNPASIAVQTLSFEGVVMGSSSEFALIDFVVIGVGRVFNGLGALLSHIGAGSTVH